MRSSIICIAIRFEEDVVSVRQRARKVAGLLGFDHTDQTRISTSASEIARNALLYAGGGEAEFIFETRPSAQLFIITIRDRGKGITDLGPILEGTYSSLTGMGMGLLGSRRLMDVFEIETGAERGTMVLMGKKLPAAAPVVTPAVLREIADALVLRSGESPLEETRLQNQELLRTLDELHRRREELEDTNRGVVALYAELDEKMIQLRGVDQLKSRFLSHMSHELRTPLNSILALSRLLLDRRDGALTPEQEKQVNYICQSANDLMVLVNDWLDIAKIEAGKVTITPKECTVEEIFSGLRGMLKPLAVNTNVDLIFIPPKDIPPLFTDDIKVAQILRNFLSNALKFTDEGTVHVSARLEHNGASIVFSVADTGTGISPEALETIFDEYVQVDSAQHGKPKGSGLGLSIARKLAELLGGSVSAQSRVKIGSTFSASIPVRFSAPGSIDKNATE